MKWRWTVKKSRVSRITRIELSRSWQRTDREYATLCLRCSACHEWARKKQRKRTSAREIYSDKRRGRPRGQTHCLQAAPSVTWPCFDKELGPLRGENLRLCCFAVSSRQTFAKSFGVSKVCSCCIVFRAQFCSEFIEKISPIEKAINNIIFVSTPKWLYFFLFFMDIFWISFYFSSLYQSKYFQCLLLHVFFFSKSSKLSWSNNGRHFNLEFFIFFIMTRSNLYKQLYFKLIMQLTTDIYAVDIF